VAGDISLDDLPARLADVVLDVYDSDTSIVATGRAARESLAAPAPPAPESDLQETLLVVNVNGELMPATLLLRPAGRPHPGAHVGSGALALRAPRGNARRAQWRNLSGAGHVARIALSDRPGHADTAHRG